MRLTELRSLLDNDLYLELKHRNVTNISWQPEQNLEILAGLSFAGSEDSSSFSELEERFFQHYYLIQAVFNSYGHKFHILTPSPWPFFTALSTLGLGLNAVYIMHADAGVFGLLFALVSFLFCLFLWWRDVLHEAVYEDKHTSVVRQGLRMGMRLFIISEVMFFFSFFWAYFHHALSPSIFIGGVWPPRGVLPFYEAPSTAVLDEAYLNALPTVTLEVDASTLLNIMLFNEQKIPDSLFTGIVELRPFWDPYVIPLAMTIVLITSGVTVTAAHTYVRVNDKKSAFTEMSLTLTLAVVFLFLQIFEYVNSPFSINTSVFGSTFFMTTGFHGFHVLIGGIFLSVWTVRLFLSFDSDFYVHPDRHVGLESAIWYWHFVDVVWIFLFFSCYWWLVPEATLLYEFSDFSNHNIPPITPTGSSGVSSANAVATVGNIASASITEKSSIMYALFTGSNPALLMSFIDVSNEGPAPSGGIFFVFNFFFKFLLLFCSSLSITTGGYALLLPVFCPVILAVLAAFTNTTNIYKTSLWFSRRLEYFFYRYFFFHLAVIAASPYRYSPIDVHWWLDWSHDVLRRFADWIDEKSLSLLDLLVYPLVYFYLTFIYPSPFFKRLEERINFYLDRFRTDWNLYGESVVSDGLKHLSECALARSYSSHHVRKDGSRIYYYEPVNHALFLAWLDSYVTTFEMGEKYSLIDIVIRPAFKCHPLKLSFFFRFAYRLFLRTHTVVGPALFSPKFSELFYVRVHRLHYMMWRLIFIQREITNFLFIVYYWLGRPLFSFRILRLPALVENIFRFLRWVVNSRFWLYARKFVRLFIRRHEFRSLWYSYLGKLQNLDTKGLRNAYSEKLKTRKRYFWEAWREQVWFVNLFNVLYLRAQRIVGVEEPHTPFARVLRNPNESRFVQYLFSFRRINFADFEADRTFESSFLLNGQSIQDPCLTQRYHCVDYRLNYVGSGRWDETIYPIEYDIFGFRLPCARSPYENYYSTCFLPSKLMRLPEHFCFYLAEESECKSVYKPITTFYRWYQLSIAYLAFSICFVLFLLGLRMGLILPVAFEQFSLPTNILSLTSASYTWFTAGSFTAVISWRLTEVSGLMLAVVAIVSTCVFIYAKDYMSTDTERRTFLVHLLFFTAFMNIFIISDDLVTLFIGWEGVGLSSFFLINFWNTRLAATKAAIKAMLVNKIGDCALLAAIVFSHLHFGTISFSVLFDSVFLSSKGFTPVIGSFTAISVLVLLLFIGSMAKSAQFGLHSWLPDAMEGPTPVSALIHAATMVTAGVLLLIKFAPLVLASQLGGTIAFVGVLTAIFAGSVALAQHDIKKVIAYSTCSQLGLMVMACGLGFPLFAFFHLVTHAFFKALLFLSAGVIVHAVDDEQDIRRMGGLQSRVPMAHAAFFIGTLCITGFPFFSGFYSKELVVLSTHLYGGSIYILCCLATMLTVVYSLRLYCYVMLGKFNGSSRKLHDLRSWVTGKQSVFVSPPIVEPWNSMLTALLILSVISILSGYTLKNFFETFAVQFQALGFSNGLSLQTEQLHVFSRWVPFLLSCAAALFYLWCFFSPKADVALTLLKMRFSLLYAGLVHKWFFDHLVNKFLVRLLVVAKSVYGLGDKGLIELLIGSRSFFTFIFSNVRQFLSKSIFGVPFIESVLLTLSVVSVSLLIVFLASF